ncbi:hypothetical protein F4604DRAFT_1788212 [Suillus subluteus]|nr:hypothetical protein F4604DRAFT_1788212 [Suillus subluteus]
MRDEHLTLLDIMDKDIPHAEFAFLSACHTAVGDEETSDEVIHQCGGRQCRRKTRRRSFLQIYVQGFGGWWRHGLYEGDLGTRLCYTRCEDKSAARAVDGFYSYRCVVAVVLLSSGMGSWVPFLAFSFIRVVLQVVGITELNCYACYVLLCYLIFAFAVFFCLLSESSANSFIAQR